MGTFDYTHAERQRDINGGLYVPFYIESPVEDAEFTLAAETVGNMIEVTLQVVDPGGDAIEKTQQVVLFFASDEDALTAEAMAGGVSVATGTLLQAVVADQHLVCLTDATGALVVELTDATGAATYYLGVVLPNGKYVVSGAIVFAA